MEPFSIVSYIRRRLLEEEKIDEYPSIQATSTPKRIVRIARSFVSGRTKSIEVNNLKTIKRCDVTLVVPRILFFCYRHPILTY